MIDKDATVANASEVDVVFADGGAPLLARLSNGTVGRGAGFHRRLQAQRQRLARGFDRLLSLDELSLQLYDHQRRAVLQVLRQMRGRAVLADEVGLGKTIEAGVILKEYIVRGLADSALILAPASLTNQWRAELDEKLALDFHVHRGGDWQGHNRVITTLETARRPEHQRVLQSRPWDVVIVDEAHRLKNRRTRSWQLVDGLQKKYLLLLTATPIQNELEELYNMMTLLQPGLLQTFGAFKRQFVQDKRSPKQLEKLHERIGRVLVRTTRASTRLSWPKRMVETVPTPLNEGERRFYDDVLTFARTVFVASEQRTNVFPLILLLRQLCSSPHAVHRTLQTFARPGRLAADHGLWASRLADRAESLFDSCTKLDKTVAWLRNAGEPVIVFTQFRATQQALAEALKRHDIRVTSFHGQLGQTERLAALAAFREKGGVLVSTEAGSEGQNLQFCRVVINYDLPWNPMRVEQRIGRVHRLGQKRDVLIVNLVAPDTIEMYVLRLLQEKIKLFEEVIGDLEAILPGGDGAGFDPGTGFANELGRIVLECSNDGDLAERFERMGERLVPARNRFDAVRRRNDELLPETIANVSGGDEQRGRTVDDRLAASPQDATATLLHPLCVDMNLAEAILGEKKSRARHPRAAAFHKRLDDVHFANGHARLTSRRLVHQPQLLFCFKVAYRSDETREQLHSFLVDPVTEKVVSEEVPEPVIDVTFRPYEQEQTIPPYVVERLFNRAETEVKRRAQAEGIVHVREARARLQRDEQRLDAFYDGLREEALMPIVQQLGRLEARRTRTFWLQSLHAGEQEPASRDADASAHERARVQRELRRVEENLEKEKLRRVAELARKYAVTAEISLVAAATLLIPRIEISYKIIRPVREQSQFYYDLLRDTFVDLDCFQCNAPLGTIYVGSDGMLLCADCDEPLAAGSG